MLRQLLARLDTCFLLIDALDELADAHRRQILSLLPQMVNWGKSRLHVFVSSRLELDLVDGLATFAESQIDLSRFQHDIKADIRRILLARWESGGWPSTHEAWFDLIDSILQETNANFLLSRLALEQLVALLSSGATRRDIQQALTALTFGAERLYDHILKRLPEQSRTLTLLTVQCVAYAARPLRLPELQGMLKIDYSDLLERHEFGSKSVLAIGGGLLNLSEPASGENGTRMVSLIHLTARDYLSEAVPTGWLRMDPHTSHAKIASYCTRHLLRIVSGFDGEQQIHEPGFTAYATEHWLYHALAIEQLGEMPKALATSIAALLQNQAMRHQILSLRNPDWPLSSLTTKEMRELLTDGTPLYYAARLGLFHACEALLELGASPLERGGRYGTPVHAAAVAGNRNIIELLLPKSGLPPDRDALVVSIEPPRHYASRAPTESDRETLRRTIENDEESGRFGSVLQLAVYGGEIRIVQSLLDLQLPISLEAMHAAAYQGYIEVFDLLWNRCDACLRDAADSRKRTALHKAALSGKRDMLKHLLSRNFNPEALDDSRSSALDLVAERHFFDCFNELLATHKWHDKHFISHTITTAIKAQTGFDSKVFEPDRAFGQKRGTQAIVRKLLRTPDGDNAALDTVIEKDYDFRQIPLADRKRALLCLWREQEILSQMAHPNVVKFLGFNFEGSQAWLYMEYWGSDMAPFVRLPDDFDISLEELGEEDRPLELSMLDLWSVVVDLASAVAYCHHGIYRTHDSYVAKAPWETVLHRDIKPQNVVRMLDNSGIWVTKLCDLGLARVTSEIKSNYSKGMGTEKHLAPELVNGGHATIKTDIYALGSTLESFNHHPTVDNAFTSLMKRCMDPEHPYHRPSSLEILQVAIAEKSRLLSPQALVQPFIPQHARHTEYLLRAFIEILNRLFRAYTLLPSEQRKIWCSSLMTLKEDASPTEWDAWQMDQSLLLTTVLKEWSRVRDLASRQSEPACESWWETQGITPLDVARREKQDRTEDRDRADKEDKRRDLDLILKDLNEVLELLDDVAASAG
ncbi:hypothetical protein LTR24_008983 [Lithohypha guttulata]|uniref:Protein kinase domain-containing protein n=1 Tax=Lithohypha guttulata TaxID=1690604 RepID=A0ABR0JYI7_9EURO|nr:hypothetical protein LTR24_008983 [Lithohypha guttulata]